MPAAIDPHTAILRHVLSFKARMLRQVNVTECARPQLPNDAVIGEAGAWR
jgi:hypothetical protein